MTSLRSRLLDLLVKSTTSYMEKYDPATGRFMTPPDGPPAPGAKPDELGWGPINQDVVYALATLYADSASPLHHDADLLEMAGRAGDAIREFQYPDGQVEFLKPDGSKWGPTYMCWTNYAWLEAYALLRDELDPARRQRWEEGLTLSHDGQAKEISGHHVHNIPAWKGMSCVRAAQLLGRDDWHQAGREMIYATVATQDPAGYWPEHGGPSTLYNLVYVHALGLYHIHTGDAAVLPALKAALDFHRTFTYPDGRVVETIDGRVKYHDNISQFAWASFSLFPEGRDYVRMLVDHADAERDSKSVQGGCLATAYQHVREGHAAGSPAAPNTRRQYHDFALTARQGPWFGCLSAFVCPPVSSRWGQDRQNFVSLWHERCGLIIGGGNSKIQPEWSTFAGNGRFMPDSGRLTDTGIALRFGDMACSLDLEMQDDRVELTARAEQGCAVHNLVLRMRKGQTLRTAGGLKVTLGDQALALSGAELGDWLSFGECRITLPPTAELHWPSYAFNPYAIDAAPPAGSEHALLSVRVDNSAATWTVSVEPSSQD